jgi:chromosome partitioning protein
VATHRWTRTLTRCVAFHSYKGGTGKTTLAANFAALLAKKGYRVFLLDLDVYAPSLQSYFETDPKKWINDFLFENADLKEVVLDFTPLIESRAGSSSSNDAQIKANTKRGQLWVGFCNAKKEEIFKLEAPQATSEQRKHLFRRFILLTELLIKEYQADYIIIDTSSGIRDWSINALVVADALLLVLKMADLDITGTRQLLAEIYGSVTKYGTKCFLLWNKIAGYCVPHKIKYDITPHAADTGTLNRTRASPLIDKQQATETDTENSLMTGTGLKVISGIPCYCDIQFSRKEFLTVLDQPEHPFARQFEQMVKIVETI